MKKLMITTLAAGAACASALAAKIGASENFDSMTAGDQLNTAADYWDYSGDNEGNTKLTITAGGKEGNFLQLNTASEKLTRAINADSSPYTVESEVYFDSYVKFDAASDTIPTVADGDKLALFVLDNTDYVESDAETALYVLGGYSDNNDTIVPRLYKLGVTVDDEFLAAWKRVTIKTYDNVMASGTATPGFVVAINGAPVPVIAAIPMTGGTPDFASASIGDGYLGVAIADIQSSIATTRYGTSQQKRQLILGLAKNATTTLTGVDFMGKGGIDELAFDSDLTTVFGEDSSIYNVPTIAGATITCNKAIVGGKVEIDPNGETLTFTVTLAEGYCYYANGEIKTGSFTLPVNATKDGSLAQVLNSGNIINAVIKVDDKPYAVSAFDSANGGELADGFGGEIVLMNNVSLADYMWINKNSTLDLAGYSISSDTGDAILADAVELTISGNGTISGNVGVDNDGIGTVVINGGTFDGAVANGVTIPVAVTVGEESVKNTAKFLATANDADALADMLTGQDATKNYAFELDATGTYFVLQVTDMPAVYTITFVIGENASWVQDYNVPANYTEGTGVDLPAAEKLVYEGFEFGGWYANADFTGYAITAIGTDATGNKTFYAKWTEVQEDVPVAPGGSTKVEATSPEEAVSKVTVTVPPEVSTEFNKIPDITADEIAELNAGYKDLFEPKATYNETTGMYDVTIELKEKVVEAIQEAVDTAATDIAEALTSATDNSVEITTKPGLWYGVVEQDTLNGINTANPKSWTLGNGKAKTFTFEKAGNSGFYKVKVSVTK